MKRPHGLDVDDLVFGAYSIVGTTLVNNASTASNLGGVGDPAEIFEDPQGWADPNPYASDWYGTTFPAKSSLSLPPGLYVWQTVGRVTANPDNASYLTLIPDWLDTADAYPTPVTDAIDDIYAGDLYLMGVSSQVYTTTSGKAAIAKSTAVLDGNFRIPRHRPNGDPVTTARVGFAWYLQADTSNRTALYVSVAVSKIV